MLKTIKDWHPKGWEKAVAEYPVLNGDKPTTIPYSDDLHRTLQKTQFEVTRDNPYKYERGVGSKVNCAAHARKKIERLVELGIPRGALHFTIVSTPIRKVEVEDEDTGERRTEEVWDGMHAVVTVDTDNGIYFLDNMTPYPGKYENMPHKPYYRESNGEWEDLR